MSSNSLELFCLERKGKSLRVKNKIVAIFTGFFIQQDFPFYYNFWEIETPDGQRNYVPDNKYKAERVCSSDLADLAIKKILWK